MQNVRVSFRYSMLSLYRYIMISAECFTYLHNSCNHTALVRWSYCYLAPITVQLYFLATLIMLIKLLYVLKNCFMLFTFLQPAQNIILMKS